MTHAFEISSTRRARAVATAVALLCSASALAQGVIVGNGNYSLGSTICSQAVTPPVGTGTYSCQSQTSNGGFALINGETAPAPNLDGNATGLSSIAIGDTTTVAAQDYAIAIGSNAVANSAGDVAIGQNAAANGQNAVSALAIGNTATASAAGSTAVGTGTMASGARATAIGLNAVASGASSIAHGDSATAFGDNSVAVGTGAVAGLVGLGTSITNDIAIGNAASAVAGNGVAIGNGAMAASDSAIALGNGAVAQNTRALYIGYQAGAGATINGSNTDDVGIGSQAAQNVNGYDNNALGARAGSNVVGAYNTGFGTDAGSNIVGTANTALGSGSGFNITGSNNLAAGIATGNYVTGSNNVALGPFTGVGTAATPLAVSSTVAIGDTALAAADNAIALGTNSLASGGSSIAFGNGATAVRSGDVALGAGSVTATANPTAGVTLNGVAYAFAGANPASVVSVGGLGAERQITNVAAGQITVSSTDAVNGSQLYATDSAVTSLGTTIANISAVNATQINTLGSSIAANLGGGATYNSTTNTVTAPSYTIQGNTYSNVGGALVAVDNSLTTLQTNSGGNTIKYFHSDSTLADSSATGTNSIAVGPASIASATDSMALGHGAMATTANSVALGSGATTVAAVATTGTTLNGTAYAFAGAVPTGVVSVGAAGAERQITNVAAGQLSATSTDAVNGSELYATNQAVTSLATGGLGTVQYSNATAPTMPNGGVASQNVTLVGANSGPVGLHNVAAGIEPTDAVNVQQLTSTTNNALSAAEGYTDNRLNGLQYQINGVQRNADAGSASAMAMSGVPQAYLPGKTMLGAGVAGYGTESAMAFGLSTLSDNGRWVLKLDGSANTRGKYGAALGAGVMW